MQRFQASYLRDLTRDIFMAAGTPREDASIVAEQLISTNLVGLDSHGIAKVPQYIGWLEVGTVVPGGPITVSDGQGGTAIVDCGRNFGQVGGLRAMQIAMAKAKEHKISCVVTHNCNHVGRLGYYTLMAAEAGMFGLAAVNSSKHGHVVVPFGGLEGRIAPNPISYAVPGPERPLVADMAMSTVSASKVHIYGNRGQKLPEGWIIDGKGRPSVDPGDLSGSNHGWLLPLGGPLGYKGFAFLLLAELLTGTLAGQGITADLPDGRNGVCFIVIDISAFTPVEHFRQLVGEMVAYMKSAPPAPGFKEVLMPGEIDFGIKADREANGIPVDTVTWGNLVEMARKLGVKVEGRR